MKIQGYPDKCLRRNAQKALGNHASGKQCEALFKCMDAADKAFGSIVWRNVNTDFVKGAAHIYFPGADTWKQEVDTNLAKARRSFEIIEKMCKPAIDEIEKAAKQSGSKDKSVKDAVSFLKAVASDASSAGKLIDSSIQADSKVIANAKKTKNPFFNVSIDEAIKNNKLAKVLLAYAKSEYSAENVEFIGIVQRGVDEKKARFLYENYIKVKAPKEINRAEKDAIAFEKALEDGTWKSILDTLVKSASVNVSDTIARLKLLDYKQLGKFGYK